MSTSPYLETLRSILLPIRSDYLTDRQAQLANQVGETATPGREFNVVYPRHGGISVFSGGWIEYISQDVPEPLVQITGTHMYNQPLVFLSSNEAHYLIELADPELKPVIADITRTYEILAPVVTGLLSRLLANYPYYIHPELTNVHDVGADIQPFDSHTLRETRLYLKAQDFYHAAHADAQSYRKRTVLQSLLSDNQKHITIVDSAIPESTKQKLRHKLG